MLDVEGRWELAPGVSRTRYSDGTEVWVNRGDRAFDGLAPQSYRFLDATTKNLNNTMRQPTAPHGDFIWLFFGA